MLRRTIVTAVVSAVALSASPALAASGIKPISPKRGDTVPVGKRPTFKMNVQGAGPVYVHVCKSKKKDADGLICTESIGKAKKKAGSRREHKPKFFNFPEFWLNSPGTYYWQAHRIACEDGIDDCRLEGPTVKFKVG